MMKEPISCLGDNPNRNEEKYPVPIMCLYELLDNDEDEDLVYDHVHGKAANGTKEQQLFATVSCRRPN